MNEVGVRVAVRGMFPFGKVFPFGKCSSSGKKSSNSGRVPVREVFQFGNLEMFQYGKGSSSEVFQFGKCSSSGSIPENVLTAN